MYLLAEPDIVAQKVAAFGLPGREPNPGITVNEAAWTGTLAALRRRAITGFAVAGMEAGWLDLLEQQAAELLDVHRQTMLAPLVVERGLLEVAPVLEEAGVEFLVLKGPAIAHTVYPDPAWRYFADLDLLVPSQDWRRACAVLESLGFKRRQPEPRPGFVERFGGAPAFRRSSGVEIDLHRTLVPGPFGLWVETDRLFDSTKEFRLGGRNFRRLDDTSLLMHACIHASLGNLPPLTLPVRDVAQVAHFARVDWDALAERSAHWKLGCVLRHAFEYASRTLDMPLPREADPIMARPSNRKERRALRAYVDDRQVLGGTALASLSAIRGFRAKSAYVLALLFPDRSFLAARMPGRASYLNRWKIPIRWLKGRALSRRRRA